MGRQWTDGYSADVELYLVMEGYEIPLSQVGPRHFVLQDHLPTTRSTTAELVIVVDGFPTRIDIVLPHGISENEKRVEFRYNSESDLAANV